MVKDKARLKALEDYAANVGEGLPFAEDYIKKDSNIEKNSLRARSLAEDALAQQVLKNTGIPIPDESAPLNKQTDFLNRIFKERYPEMEPDIKVLPSERITGMVGEPVHGFYQPETEFKKPQIIVNQNELIRGGPTKAVGTMLHEAGHQYDDKILKASTDELDLETLRKLVREGVDLKSMDPAQVYELYGKKHHAQIPKLREGTFGLGALKSYLKSGTFKALPIIGTAAAGAAALSSPDASAAAMDMAIPGGLESLGPSEEDATIEKPQANPAARKAALQKLMGR